jgi:hypothetical protein
MIFRHDGSVYHVTGNQTNIEKIKICKEIMYKNDMETPDFDLTDLNLYMKALQRTIDNTQYLCSVLIDENENKDKNINILKDKIYLIEEKLDFLEKKFKFILESENNKTHKVENCQFHEKTSFSF